MQTRSDVLSGILAKTAPDTFELPNTTLIAAGDVFVKDSVAYKVSTVATVGSRQTIKTVTPLVSEALSSLRIAGEAELTNDHLEAGSLPPEVELLSVSVSERKSALAEVSVKPIRLKVPLRQDGLELALMLELRPRVVANLDWSTSDGYKGLELRVTGTASASLTASAAADAVLKRKFSLGTFCAPAGLAGPLVKVCMPLQVDISGTFTNVKASITVYQQNYNIDVGISHTPGSGVNYVRDLNRTSSYSDFSGSLDEVVTQVVQNTDMRVSVRGTPVLGAELRVLGMIGGGLTPEIGAEAFFSGKMDYWRQRLCGKIGLDAVAALKARFDITFAQYLPLDNPYGLTEITQSSGTWTLLEGKVTILAKDLTDSCKPILFQGPGVATGTITLTEDKCGLRTMKISAQHDLTFDPTIRPLALTGPVVFDGEAGAGNTGEAGCAVANWRYQFQQYVPLASSDPRLGTLSFRDPSENRTTGDYSMYLSGTETMLSGSFVVIDRAQNSLHIGEAQGPLTLTGTR